MIITINEITGAVTRHNDNNINNHPYGSILIADGNELNCKKAEKKMRTKFMAREKICNLMPVWKQHNLSARSIELVEKKLDGTITGDEITELNMIRNTWTGLIKPIRTSSDAIEAEIDNLTLEDIDSYSLWNNPLWP